MVSQQPFSVLLVCTANICRSPLAAGLLRRRLDQASAQSSTHVRVASAGTRALVGRPMDPPMERLLQARGGSASDVRARQLDERTLVDVDLVLTMSRVHRPVVVALAPSLLHSTFTLRELTRIAAAWQPPRTLEGADMVERLRTLAAAAPGLRRSAAADQPGDDDVVDPYRQPPEVYRQVADGIETAVTALVSLLRGDPCTGGTR